jgi:3-deoxy-manno-octulosonate cytidylyltransferase (CMP-KDO synthetase)
MSQGGPNGVNVIGVIPARFQSSRFPGKVLAHLGPKTIIQYVWENAKQARLLDDLVVATDDRRIVEEVEKFGGRAVLTSPAHSSGTDRIAEVVNPIDVKVVVNIQADEPFLRPTMIDGLADALLKDSDVQMATLIKKIEAPSELSDPNVVKVVFNKLDFALYFSRTCLPCDSSGFGKGFDFYKHIGIYAYTKEFLFVFKNLPPSQLEKAERLEQLRVLEAGFRIKVIQTDVETIGIDTPEDLENARKLLAAGIKKKKS